MTIEVMAKMFYSSKEAAGLLGIEYRKLLTWIKDGYLPKRVFSNAMVVSGDDFERIVQLANGANLVAAYADSEPATIGYTLAEIADAAGVAHSTARLLVADGTVHPLQDIAGKPVFDASAIDALRNAPPRDRRRKRVDELLTLPAYKRGIPPLTEREQRILALYDGTGASLADIGKREWGISRQAATSLYNRARAKRDAIASGKPMAMPLDNAPREKRLSKVDRAILTRASEGNSNAEIAAALDKSGVTEGTVQRRLRKWARIVEDETGTAYERVPLATYVLTKYGVTHEPTAA